MPGSYPGRVITVHSPTCIDESTEKVDVPTVQRMIASGMTTLTGVKDPRDSWARFYERFVRAGCLKNIAYGEFTNVARSHYKAQTETLTFIGTLANVEPLRSPLFDGEAVPLLSQTDEVRNRSGGYRPFSHRHHRQQAEAGGRDFRLGARHEVLQPEAGRLAGQSEREPIYPGTRSHRVCVKARSGRVRYGQIHHTEITI